MSYQQERLTVIGVELEPVLRRLFLDDDTSEHFNEHLSEQYPAGSLQDRFANGDVYQASNGQTLSFTIGCYEAGYDSRVGNPTDDAHRMTVNAGMEPSTFGGQAGFDITDLPLAERGSCAAILPELATVIAARLTALGRPTDPNEVVVHELDVLF